MPLPDITHLQFLVLGVLLEGIRTGRELRERLGDHGVRKSGPAFYQMMARLEDGGLVQGDYEQQVVDGQMIKQRHYTVTPAGVDAWEGSRDFYVRSIRDFEDRRGSGMPERAQRPWRGLGRILPAYVRDRLFEPAYHDLFADGAHRRRGFALRVFLMTIDCARVGVTSALVRRGRPTPTGWALLALGTITAVLGALAGMAGNYHQPPG